MTVHLFQSAREPDVFGFTRDESGTHLPVELGPWTRAGTAIEAETGMGALADTGLSRPVIAAIEKDGFYIARSETFSRDNRFGVTDLLDGSISDERRRRPSR